MPYFTTAELRALPDLLGQEARFPDARLVEAHDWIVDIIERECEAPFVTTTVTGERVNGSGCDGITFANPYVIAVSAVTIDGAVMSAPDVALLYVERGTVYRPNRVAWPATSRGNITATYTHGYTATPPADLKQAALRAARNWLLTMDAWSGVDVRSTSISNEFGNIQLSVPGPGRPTGIPDVDAVIMGYAALVRVPAAG